MPVHQESLEEKKDVGFSYELIGGMVLFFDFLILFFYPAGLKIGEKSLFVAIMGVIAVVAFAFIVYGHVLRSRADR